MSKVIGLTGSIAVGKSTVTQYLLNHGYQVVDADILSRQALDVGTQPYDQVKALFGCVEHDGTINRQRLGDIVFHDSQLKKQLEDIVHPYVIKKIKEAIKNCQEDFIFLDIPLLFETHLEELCDKIIVVYVDETTQMNRLMKRNGISQQAAIHLIHQQISIEEKKNWADFVIDNRYSHQELYQEIERVLKVLKDEVIYE